MSTTHISTTIRSPLFSPESREGAFNFLVDRSRVRQRRTVGVHLGVAVWVDATRICRIHKRAVNRMGTRVVTKAGIGRSVRGPCRGKLNLSMFCTGASAHFNNRSTAQSDQNLCPPRSVTSSHPVPLLSGRKPLHCAEDPVPDREGSALGASQARRPEFHVARQIGRVLRRRVRGVEFNIVSAQSPRPCNSWSGCGRSCRSLSPNHSLPGPAKLAIARRHCSGGDHRRNCIIDHHPVRALHDIPTFVTYLIDPCNRPRAALVVSTYCSPAQN